MAHFAQLNTDNIVTQVIVIDNSDMLDENGIESEAIGAALCDSLIAGTWVQTSYNATFRGNYAGVGFSYNSAFDVFMPPKPYASWVRDVATWVAPIPYPTDGKEYIWHEDTLTWNEKPPRRSSGG